MTDYLVTESPTGGGVTLWEVDDARLGIGPASLPLLTVGPEGARTLAQRLLHVADEVSA